MAYVFLFFTGQQKSAIPGDQDRAGAENTRIA